MITKITIGGVETQFFYDADLKESKRPRDYPQPFILVTALK